MTTITHTADGPRFDGMTVGELIASLDREATILEAANEEGVPYIRSIIAALRHLSEWQPIETAPRDGKPVLVSHPQDYPRVARYATSLEEGDGAWIVARRVGADPIAFVYAAPTCWRPLPPGPDGGGA